MLKKSVERKEKEKKVERKEKRRDKIYNKGNP